MILGPAPAPMALLRGRYRYRLLINARRSAEVQQIIRDWLGALSFPQACGSRSTSIPTASSSQRARPRRGDETAARWPDRAGRARRPVATTIAITDASSPKAPPVSHSGPSTRLEQADRGLPPDTGIAEQPSLGEVPAHVEADREPQAAGQH